MHDLTKLAQLIKQRNLLEEEITAVIGRPAQIGHLGEYIAAQIFDIQLEESAVAKGIDGYFQSSPIKNRSVNIKWYAKQEGIPGDNTQIIARLLFGTSRNQGTSSLI